MRLWTRRVPGLHAAHKVSVDVLWVAPLLNLALLALLALALHAAFRILPARMGRFDRPVTWFLAAGIGATGVAMAPAVLHPASIAVLAAGVGVLVARGRAGALAPGPRHVAVAGSLVVVAALGAWAWGPIAERARRGGLGDPEPSAPNVLFLMLDTVRRDELLGGEGERNAPTLTALAREGVWFEDAWSVTSWSLPSQASALTGLDPAAHRADWPSFDLAPEATTLAETFAAKGWATGAFSGNSSWITREYLGRGFLRFRTYVAEDLIRRTSLGKGLDGLGRAFSFYAAGRGKKAPRIHEQLLDFVDDYADRPFFAYVCYMDANHAIYARKFNRYFRREAPLPEVHEAYQEGLRVLDGQIGDLLAELRRRGLLESTILVVASDHGESFGPEVRDDHRPIGHGTHLYPEQSRIPLFIVAPGRIAAGGRVAEPVSLAGVPATLSGLLGWTESFPGDPLPLGESPSPPAEEASPVRMTLRYLDRDLRGLAIPGWQYIEDGAGAAPGELLKLEGDLVGEDVARDRLPREARRLFPASDDGRETAAPGPGAP